MHPDMPAEEAARYAKGLIDRTIMAFLPSDLTFLRAGGRLSNARYIGAQILKVKPCVEAIDGKLVATKKYHGSMRRSALRFLGDMLEHNPFERKSIRLLRSPGLSDRIASDAEVFLQARGFEYAAFGCHGGLCIVLMLANVLLTMGAFDSWYRRMDGISAPTPIQSFFATHFDDDFMEGRFQNMSLFPNDTIRPQK